MGKHTKNRTREPLAPEVAEHLERLALATEDQYLDWCERQGVGARLRKSAQERQRERELREKERASAALQSARDLQRRPQETLTQVISGKCSPAYLQRPELAAMVRLCEETKPPHATRETFLRLLRVAMEQGTLLRTEPVVERYGQDRAFRNTFIGGLLALATHEPHWLRPLETWRPTSHNPRRQFASLVRHLLVRYELPACFDSVWFHTDPPRAEEQQRWFVQAGLGHNPRQVGFPVTLTKRMAHLLLSAVPEYHTLEEALRWAQVVGMGGSAALAQAICATSLGHAFCDEPFWETVVRFFVNHPLLDLTQVGPLIDYLRHERETPTYLPVGFTLAGRSPAALLQRMEQWHGQLAQQRKTARTIWAPASWKGMRVEEPVAKTESVVQWDIAELTTAKELVAEGAAMHHCVGTYVSSCARGAVSVWSLTRKLPWEAAPQRVMTIAVTPQRYVTEARGKYNALPGSGSRRLGSDEAATLVRGWRYFQLWVAREGLTLPAYLRH